MCLDTSVPSAFYDENAKERQEATKDFWKLTIPNYCVYISEITLEELNETKDDILKTKLLELVCSFEILKINSQISDLSKLYLKEGVFSKKYSDDALHVATATFYEINYLISWNFQHLVKVKTR
ncbi:PIN domain-containing protein [bacterium]|nr:PIN domain-containing protein [bacterium]